MMEFLVWARCFSPHAKISLSLSLTLSFSFCQSPHPFSMYFLARLQSIKHTYSGFSPVGSLVSWPAWPGECWNRPFSCFPEGCLRIHSCCRATQSPWCWIHNVMSYIGLIDGYLNCLLWLEFPCGWIECVFIFCKMLTLDHSLTSDALLNIRATVMSVWEKKVVFPLKG